MIPICYEFRKHLFKFFSGKKRKDIFEVFMLLKAIFYLLFLSSPAYHGIDVITRHAFIFLE